MSDDLTDDERDEILKGNYRLSGSLGEHPRMMPLEDVARIVARLTAELADTRSDGVERLKQVLAERDAARAEVERLQRCLAKRQEEAVELREQLAALQAGKNA